MKYDQYDKYIETALRELRLDEVPLEDRITFLSFGTIHPRIAYRPHRLIKSDKYAFTKLLKCINCEAAMTGRYIPFLKDNEADLSIIEEARAWSNHNNQKWLIDHINSLKFEDNSQLKVIFNARLPDAVLLKFKHELEDNLDVVLSQMTLKTWFDLLNEMIDQMIWLYIPLPEYTYFDFFVSSESFARQLDYIDSLFDDDRWLSRLTQKDDRWQWPLE